ncbi:unnamed protein product [Symbiodinium sp. CCMP2592]|nr:unnamed protein product [Symbiodinium sp. CCMP2592]
MSPAVASDQAVLDSAVETASSRDRVISTAPFVGRSPDVVATWPDPFGPPSGDIATDAGAYVQAAVLGPGFRTAVVKLVQPVHINETALCQAVRAGLKPDEFLEHCILLPASVQPSDTFLTFVQIPKWVAYSEQRVVVIDLSAFHEVVFAAYMPVVLESHVLEQIAEQYHLEPWAVYLDDDPTRQEGTLRILSGSVLRFIPLSGFPTLATDVESVLACEDFRPGDVAMSLLGEGPPSWLTLCEDSMSVVPYAQSETDTLKEVVLRRIGKPQDEVIFAEPAASALVPSVFQGGRAVRGILGAVVCDEASSGGSATKVPVFIDARALSLGLIVAQAPAALAPSLTMLTHACPQVSRTEDDPFAVQFVRKTVHFAIFAPCCIPEIVSIEVDFPAGESETGELLSLARGIDADIRFEFILPACPQPQVGHGCILALPLWAAAKTIVLLDSRQVDGRIFSLVLDPWMQWGSFLLQSGLGGRESITVHVRNRLALPERPLTFEQGDLVTVLPSDSLLPRLFDLPFKLNCSGLWETEAPQPVVDSKNTFLMLTDGLPRLAQIDRRQIRELDDFRAAAALALSCSVDSLTCRLSRPKISDCMYLGTPWEAVLLATESLRRIPVPPGRVHALQVVVFFDLRAVLQGFSWCLLEGGIAPLTDLENRFRDRLPDDHQVCINGGVQEMQGEVTYLRCDSCTILAVEYIPNTEAGDVQDPESSEESSDDSSDSNDEPPATGVPRINPDYGEDRSRTPRNRAPPQRGPRKLYLAHSASPAAALLLSPGAAAFSLHSVGEVAFSAHISCIDAQHTTGDISAVAVCNCGDPVKDTAVCCAEFLAASWTGHSWVCRTTACGLRIAECLVSQLTAESVVTWRSGLHAPRTHKWLAEPVPTTRSMQESLAALRYYAPLLGRGWRYTPQQPFLSLRDASDSEDSSTEEGEVNVLFVVLVPGYLPEVVHVTLNLPATVPEVLSAVSQARDPAPRDRFPLLVPASPQPRLGSGAVIAFAEWQMQEHLICIDSSCLDGRVFAMSAPAYVTRQQVLALANVSERLGVSVYIGIDDLPLADDVYIHTRPGLTVFIVPPDEGLPVAYPLEQVLVARFPWNAEPPLPAQDAGQVYCLVHEECVMLFVMDPRHPTAYRRQIAACVGVPESHLQLVPASRRVVDATLDGLLCRTVIAVHEERPGDARPPCIVIIDARALAAGWWSLLAQGGQVSHGDLVDAVRVAPPAGWSLRIAGIVPDGHFAVQPGQVFTVEVCRLPIVDFGRAHNHEAGLEPTESATDATQHTAVVPEANHSVTASGDASRSISATQVDGPANLPDSVAVSGDTTVDVMSTSAFLAGTFVIVRPEYCPELVSARLPVGVSVDDALAAINSARAPFHRQVFPRVCAVHPQSIQGVGVILAVPLWIPSGAIVIVDATRVTGALFASHLPTVATHADVFHIAGVQGNTGCEIYHRDLPWPVPQGQPLRLSHGDAIVLVPAGHVAFATTSLQALLLSESRWSDDWVPDIPFTDLVWVLSDFEDFGFIVAAGRRMHFRNDIASQLGVTPHSLILRAPDPMIVDHAALCAFLTCGLCSCGFLGATYRKNVVILTFLPAEVDSLDPEDGILTVPVPLGQRALQPALMQALVAAAAGPRDCRLNTPAALALLAHGRPFPTPLRGRDESRPRSHPPTEEPVSTDAVATVAACRSSGFVDPTQLHDAAKVPAVPPCLSLCNLLPLSSWDPDPVEPSSWEATSLQALHRLGRRCLNVGGVPCPFSASQLWDLLCPKVSLVTLEDLCQLLPAADVRYLSTLDPNPGAIPAQQVWCYTDGSYTPPTQQQSVKMGWACVFVAGDPFCFSIVAGCVPPCFLASDDVPSAFIAECCALTAALWMGTTAYRGYSLVYKSDCKAALFVVETGQGNTDGAAAGALRSIRIFVEALAKYPPAFEHTPGHTGNFGNELADAAARAAARGVEIGSFHGSQVILPLSIGGVLIPVTPLTPLEISPAEQVAPFLPVNSGDSPSVATVSDAWLALSLVSYNVLSLNGEAFADGTGQGIAYAAGRPAMLASTLREHDVGVAFLQEARTQEGFLNTAEFLRFCSGTERGHLGVEIWLRRDLPIVTRGREQLVSLSKDACSVLLSDPRRLVVHFQQGKLRLHFVCLHAPHRGHPDEVISTWWHDTFRRCTTLARIAPLVLGGDLNACVGSITDAAISDAFAEPQDLAGSFVQDFAASCQLWFPATWEASQQGPGWTFFQKRNAAATRPDFVALPQVWRDAKVEAWVEPSIHAGQACLDHLATVLKIGATLSGFAAPSRVRKPRIDAAALRAPANRDRLKGVLSSLPTIPWQVSADTHAAVLVKHLHEALAAEFPVPKAAPRSSYLSAETWQLHRHVAVLRHRCARLRVAVRRHTLAAFLAIWRGSSSGLPSDFLWARQAAAVGTDCGEQLRAASMLLRQRCKEDRTAYLATLADAVQANQADGAAALQQLLKQKRKKPFTPEVLPRLRKADGTLCQSGIEITDRWRQHFGDMEAGCRCQPGDLAGAESVGNWPLPPSLLDIPAPGELLRALAASKAGKAPGPDMVPGEALSGAPPALVLHLLPLLLKFCIRGTEAIGLQGSTLCTLYKQRGPRDDCSSYRAIMLLPAIAKALHRSLRPRLYRHIDACAPSTLLGGRRGATVVFGGHLVRSFCRWQNRIKGSFAVIFADVASAYYSSLRELTARHPCAKGDPRNLDFLPDHEGLLQQLDKPSVLRQGGASDWLEAVVAEMHRRTWFTIAGDGHPVQTRRGSRPGSTFADLMFGAGVSAILGLKNTLRAATPGAAAKPSIPWDGRRDFSHASAPVTSVPLDDIVWADDVAECVVLNDAASAAVCVATSTSNFAEAFASFGYSLTFGATKTAAMIKLTGPGSRQARSSLYGRQASLPVLLENLPPAELPVVTSYKHLGMMQSPTSSLLVEIKFRCGSAWQAFRQGRKAVYRNKKLSLARRGTLLGSAVLTRLFFGAGSWPLLRSGEEQTLSGTLMSILRQTLCVPHEDDQHVCRAETCALLGVADPITSLRVERLRYARQLVAAAPDALWALTRLDAGLLEAYRDAFSWLYCLVRATVPLPDPLSDWAPWQRVMTERPGRFRGWVKRAKRLAVLRLTCGAALFALARCVREAGSGRDPTNTGNDEKPFTEACIPCRMAFGWGNFQAHPSADDVAPHPAAPPLQLGGHVALAEGVSRSPEIHPGLLSALLDIAEPDETLVWDTVADFIAPLAHLRATVGAWAAHDSAHPDAPDLASNVVLLLDPDLCCDTFRHRPKVPKGLDFLPALAAPLGLSFSFVLTGSPFVMRLDPPPLPEFRYPFRCSVPLTVAERHARWFEAACDSVGLLVQQAKVAPVKLGACSAALACLEPVTTWLVQGGFERCQDGMCSPTS